MLEQLLAILNTDILPHPPASLADNDTATLVKINILSPTAPILGAKLDINVVSEFISFTF